MSTSSAFADAPRVSRWCVFQDKAAEALAKFIPHSAKDSKACVLISFGRRRVLNAPMNERGLARKDRAALLGGGAAGNDIVEVLADKFLHRLRALPGSIHAQLTQKRDGFRAHAAGLCAGTGHVKAIASLVPQQPFGHLAPRGIGSAQN